MKYTVTHERLRLIDLQVDFEGYQRRRIATLVDRLAKYYSEDKAGELRVSRRPDGTLFVFDGQHRAEAAKLIGLVDHACQVWTIEPTDGETPSQAEAKLYEELNTKIKPLIPSERFKAAVHAGEDIAILIKNVLAGQGIQQETYRGAGKREPNTIYGSGSIQKIYGWKSGPSILNDTLILLRKTWPDDPDAFQSIIIEGAAYFVKKSQGQYSLDTFTWAIGATPATIYKEQARTAAIIGASGYQYMILANAFLRVYNKKVRPKDRIQWDMQEEED